MKTEAEIEEMCVQAKKCEGFLEIIRSRRHKAGSSTTGFRGSMAPAGASLVAQLVKNPPAMLETLVRFLGREDPLEKR